VVFGPRVRGEIMFGGPISNPGLLRSVKEILDEFLSSGCLGCLERAQGLKPLDIAQESGNHDTQNPELS
jgi:hypothetical protein